MSAVEDFENEEHRTDRRLLCSDLVTVRWTGARGFTREEVAVLEDFSRIGAGLFMAAKINPPMTKTTPRRKFWLMTARVCRESFTKNGKRRRSLFISAMVAL